MKPTAEQLDFATTWLMGNDTGLSSKTLLGHAIDKPNKDGWYECAPSDPADLGRCLRLIAKAPWVRTQGFPSLKGHPEWGPLIANWDELEALMAREVGIDWSKGSNAPHTFARMKQLLGRGGNSNVTIRVRP